MPLQFGIWAPVCGGWLRVINPERNWSISDLVELAVQADRVGYDFYYIPEHYLNAVHGPAHDVRDFQKINYSCSRIIIILGV
ncbi:MAG: hypothetical protein ACKO2T_07440 [Microcystis aeruginosa]